MRSLRRLLLPLLLIVAAFALPRASEAQVAVSITVAPPPLPVYAQPVIPGPGWIWAPGYWAWAPYGYYWVPGTWVRPPRVGLLWTPGYWGWVNGFYVWHAGYWGPHVGFYGGVNYGFGYVGVGYFGGFWDHGVFHYNSAVTNIRNVHITNVYRQTTVNNIDITRNVTRVSYNGGQGGIAARPTAQEETFARERHVGPTALQQRHENGARNNRSLRASVNHGHPHIAATPRPTAFNARGVAHAEGSAPEKRPAVHRANAAMGPGQGGQHGHNHPQQHAAEFGGQAQGGGGPDRPHP